MKNMCTSQYEQQGGVSHTAVIVSRSYIKTVRRHGTSHTLLARRYELGRRQSHNCYCFQVVHLDCETARDELYTPCKEIWTREASVTHLLLFPGRTFVLWVAWYELPLLERRCELGRRQSYSCYCFQVVHLDFELHGTNLLASRYELGRRQSYSCSCFQVVHLDCETQGTNLHSWQVEKLRRRQFHRFYCFQVVHLDCETARDEPTLLARRYEVGRRQSYRCYCFQVVHLDCETARDEPTLLARRYEVGRRQSYRCYCFQVVHSDCETARDEPPLLN